ncbi:MAG: methyl-accepting chemotaxis protein [Proteobacteria bacterium]|nr:methyl-accepting chemotaxis protein [Pseudomonadota bacterium]MBU1386813.1 methyl-accepting chemotaxis protein [Pseudomonadota bacterium]MBU1544757.1 methyl-accepting chemotaxis protein [Pseudomonadota bacterium]MBU2483016.1 methyl-accepting chemotaxis protein [Pseudomonadota bacterium]
MAKIGFDKKLIAGSAGIILITVLIMAIVNFYQSQSSFLSKGQTSIQNVSDVLLKAVELKYNLQKEKLESEIGALITEAQAGGSIMIVDVDPAEIDIYDFYSKTKKTRTEVPKMVFGLEFVTDDYIIVDKVSKGSSSDIAVYQMFDNKLLKVSSSLQDENAAKAGADDEEDAENSNRIIGEYFSSSTDVYKDIVQQKSVIILTRIGKDLAMQLLQPIKHSQNGSVIGAYSVASKILTQDLVSLIDKVNVSGSGYSFVNNPAGDILIHPNSDYLSLNVSAFENGKALLKETSAAVKYGHDNKTFYSYVNYFAPWELYFTVAVSEGELMAGVSRQIMTSSAASGFLALIVGMLIIMFMNRQLMKSMRGMAKLAQEVAQGNFKYKFSYEAKDAIKDTVDAMNEMVEGLAQMIKELNAGVHTLSSASGELNLISDKMSEGAEITVSKVNTVASAAEEMSVNMDSVAAAMEQASTNVEIVATGTNDMSANIEKVSQNSINTKKITNRAVEQAQQTSERVKKLGRAAEEINNVTDTINSISSQTNLLALNATIEAARAGEAGKGFAVVANEIKELAGQTARATEDIAENIQTIQDQISGAVHEIQEISEIINQIDNFVNEAASAIELQSATTTEIAENINQVSAGIREVNINVSQSSDVSAQVAKEISDVLAGSQEINGFSTTVKEKAKILTDVMRQLDAMTGKFKV